MNPRVAAALSIALLTGCGGGGSGTPSTTGSTGGGVPTPPALSTQAYHVIGPDAVHAVVIAKAGSPVTAPPGFQILGPLANGVLTYPDGSTQMTDANGKFSPAAASYVQKYSALLQSSSVVQPAIKITSSSGVRGTATLAALAASSSAALAGVTVAPNAARLFSGETIVLSATGTGTDDRVASLDNASITWNSAAGATIAPIGGTAQAVYIAPATAASDVITATVHAASGAAYSATSHVATIPVSQGYAVSGTIVASSGGPMANASAVFLADDPPRVYPSFDFYAQADANGLYNRLLPPNATFGLAVFAPGAMQAALTGTSTNELQTGSSGASGIANLTALSGAYDDTKDDASNAFPDPIVSVRDAWFAQQLTRPYPFWADSGVLGVLGAPAVVNAPAAPIGSGLLARWCYQWQPGSGGNVLTIVENADASCSSPGNEAFQITPQPASGSYAFTQYRLLSGAYALGGTLSPQANAQVVATGTWQQSLSGPATTPTGDSAQVRIAFYGPAGGGAAIAQASFAYTYAPNGTGAVMQITNAALNDAAGNTLAAASASAARSVGASGCAGSSAACYAGSAAITRTYAGAVTRSYQSQYGIEGDGSMSFSVASTNATDASAVTFAVAPVQTRASGSCIICATGPGALIDVDGQTRIGSFTVAASQLVSFDLLDTAEGDAAGQPIDALTFGL